MFAAILFKGYIVFVGADFHTDNNKYVNVSMEQAKTLASERGMLLPNPDLVDAIYTQASCKASTRAFTPEDTQSMDKMNKAAQTAVSDCQDTSLVAGHYKSITMVNGTTGLYGWYRSNGTRVQPFFAGHSMEYVDYSQAVRFVHPVAIRVHDLRTVDTKEVLK